jgi:antitoxin ParD1/3/4
LIEKYNDEVRSTIAWKVAKMNQVSLNLPDVLQQFVASEATSGGYNGPAGYIEALIARAKTAKARVDGLLVEGLESGEAIPLDDNEWARIRSEVTRRIAHG